MVRTAAFVVVTVVLTVAAVARVGRWALAEPARAVAVVQPSTTTTAPAFRAGVVVRSRRSAPPRPTTTLAAGPARPWTWDQLAACESSNRWDAVRGVYQGGLQFDARTWDHYAPAFGFPTDAQLATREQQIAVAERVLAEQGAKAWPTCGPRIGMSGGPATDPTLPAAGPPDDVPD